MTSTRCGCSGLSQGAWSVKKAVGTLHVTVQPIKAIGKGAYGVVVSARVGKTDKVAIKKIQNAFDNEIDARRTLREVILLRQLKHENIVALRDVLLPPSPAKDKFKDVYLVYELMDTDLHQIIRSKQPLSDDHFQYFIYQVRPVQRCAAGNPGARKHLLVPCPDSAGIKVRAQCGRAAPGPQAEQSAAQRVV